MKHYIKKRCQDYAENPNNMIKSLLEKKKRVINLDRIIIKNTDRTEELINDLDNIKQYTIHHFQSIAGSINRPKITGSE